MRVSTGLFFRQSFPILAISAISDPLILLFYGRAELFGDGPRDLSRLTIRAPPFDWISDRLVPAICVIRPLPPESPTPCFLAGSHSFLCATLNPAKNEKTWTETAEIRKKLFSGTV